MRELAGGRHEQLELNALVQRVTVTDDRHRATQELPSRWSAVTTAEILESPYALIGTVDEIVEGLEARRSRWGISYYTVFEPALDVFAPVVARLAGR